MTTRSILNPMTIFGALLIAGSLALYSVGSHASSLPPDAGFTADAAVDNGLGTSPSWAAVVPEHSGLGTSPSVPASPDWLLKAAGVLVLGLGLLRKAQPAFFAKDGVGAATGFAVAMAYTVAEAISRGKPMAWGLAKDGFTLAVVAWGGYSVVYRKLLRPLLGKLCDALGWPWPASIFGER